jgi:cytochrome P450
MGLWGSLLRDLQNDMASGIKRHNCLIETYLRQRAEAGHGTTVPGIGLTDDGWLRDTALAYTAATVLEAGSEPTVGAMEAFILFMLANPEVLKRLREEIDLVVGSERMPTFEDEEKLPYLVACIKETLRIRPPLLTGEFF